MGMNTITVSSLSLDNIGDVVCYWRPVDRHGGFIVGYLEKFEMASNEIYTLKISGEEVTVKNKNDSIGIRVLEED